MADESREPSASFDLHTCSRSEQTVPTWLTEVLVLLRALGARWLLLPLEQQVRVERGRAGKFEAIDFVLVLFVYAISGAKTLKELYKQAGPVRAVLAGAWLRDVVPGRSALSRFLGDVSSANVEQVRTLF